MLSMELPLLHGDEREQGYGSGPPIPDRVIVTEAPAVVLEPLGSGLLLRYKLPGLCVYLTRSAIRSIMLSAVDNNVDSRWVWRGDSGRQRSTRGLACPEQRQKGADEKGGDAMVPS
jgi:hypothetical protein